MVRAVIDGFNSYIKFGVVIIIKIYICKINQIKMKEFNKKDEHQIKKSLLLKILIKYKSMEKITSLFRKNQTTDSLRFDLKDNKFITVNIDKNFTKSNPLIVKNMLSKPVIVSLNVHLDRNKLLSNLRKVTGIYLLHNNVNGKQYIGSAYDLSKRLSNYFYPSRLLDKRYVSNSILKYGHNNFIVVILEIISITGEISKLDILKREQYFIDLYKPILNMNPKAGSSLGFKQTKESKLLISEF